MALLEVRAQSLRMVVRWGFRKTWICGVGTTCGGTGSIQSEDELSVLTSV